MQVQGVGDRWGEFISWGERFYRWKAIIDAERNDKLQAAQTLRQSHEALANGPDEWLKLLKKAFSDNFVAWQVHTPFLDWCRSQPYSARSALSALWDSPKPSGEVVDAFLKQIPVSNGFSPGVPRGTGGSTCLVAFLLMAADPHQYPPYRHRIFDGGYRLTGTSAPANSASAGDVYERALAFLDSLNEKALEHNLELRDRLDAQTVLYSIVKKPVEEEPASTWTRKERLELLEYRTPRRPPSKPRQYGTQ